jgi:tRNA threonylcarbamoyl adenosine modification protein (Sua5/YciO/YrdC/YwlC family)
MDLTENHLTIFSAYLISSGKFQSLIMKIFRPDAGNISEVVAILRKGGVVAHPADTCFGLAADLMNEKALKKIQQIKGRDAKKPMSIMLPAYMKTELSKYVKLSDFAREVCDVLLPGPVTIVLPKGPNIPDYFFPEVDSIGIRIPYHLFTEDVLTQFHGPLITTSANLSNEPVCCDHDEFLTAFKGKKYQPDLLVEGKILNECMPSTVIKVEREKITILREGPLKKDQLEAILGIRI